MFVRSETVLGRTILLFPVSLLTPINDCLSSTVLAEFESFVEHEESEGSRGSLLVECDVLPRIISVLLFIPVSHTIDIKLLLLEPWSKDFEVSDKTSCRWGPFWESVHWFPSSCLVESSTVLCSSTSQWLWSEKAWGKLSSSSSASEARISRSSPSLQMEIALTSQRGGSVLLERSCLSDTSSSFSSKLALISWVKTSSCSSLSFWSAFPLDCSVRAGGVPMLASPSGVCPSISSSSELRMSRPSDRDGCLWSHTPPRMDDSSELSPCEFWTVLPDLLVSTESLVEELSLIMSPSVSDKLLSLLATQSLWTWLSGNAP